MKLKLSRKSAITATIASIIVFLLFVLLWPIRYWYEAPVNCPPAGGAQGIYNCAVTLWDKNGRLYSPATATAPLPLIYTSSKSVTSIEYRSTLYRALISAAVCWLLAYELTDKYSVLRSSARKPKLKSR